MYGFALSKQYIFMNFNNKIRKITRRINIDMNENFFSGLSPEKKKRLIIYLADLDHFRFGNRFSVPLGIGSIASYCKSIYGDAVDISLFKNPDELMEEIRQKPPDILGCSFFMWNTNLTLKTIKACKIINSKIITVIGGPSVARNSDSYKKIFKNCPSLDIIVLDQGEKSFSNILNRILKNNFEFETELIFSESIDGCAVRLSKSKDIVRGKIETQHIDINAFPSPYLMGYFDKFLQAGFLPTFETTRGCPYQCTFCCGGINSFLPISVKDEKKVYDELLYILEHSTTKELDLADTNFGVMGERDLRISFFMLDLYKKTGFPQIVSGASAKRKTKTSIETITNMAEIMGYLYFALQTLTEDVLVNCKRKNIPMEMIEELVAISKKNRRPIVVDMIFGLPGETLKSFFETIDKILSLGIAAPAIYMLKMLPGTIIAEQDRKKYGYKTKFRVLNGRYGEYELISGQKPVRVVEIEEIAWQNNSFDLNDYLTIRSFGFISMLLMGQGTFSDTVFFLLSRGIKITKIFKIIQDNYIHYPRLQALFNEYKIYSEKELFDSHDELINQITNNDGLWNDLLNDQGIFFKLDLGFSGYCLFEDIKALTDIEDIISKAVKDMLVSEDFANLREVFNHDKLYRIIQDKKPGKLIKADVKKEIITEEMFDYEKWKDSNFKGNLKDYCLKIPIKKIYYMEKFDLLNSIIDQYSKFNGYVFYEKIIIWGVNGQRRLCRTKID